MGWLITKIIYHLDLVELFVKIKNHLLMDISIMGKFMDTIEE
jgi:hypothetical protein